jgi:hypothetical protein
MTQAGLRRSVRSRWIHASEGPHADRPTLRRLRTHARAHARRGHAGRVDSVETRAPYLGTSSPKPSASRIRSASRIAYIEWFNRACREDVLDAHLFEDLKPAHAIDPRASAAPVQRRAAARCARKGDNFHSYAAHFTRELARPVDFEARSVAGIYMLARLDMGCGRQRGQSGPEPVHRRRRGLLTDVATRTRGAIEPGRKSPDLPRTAHRGSRRTGVRREYKIPSPSGLGCDLPHPVAGDIAGRCRSIASAGTTNLGAAAFLWRA